MSIYVEDDNMMKKNGKDAEKAIKNVKSYTERLHENRENPLCHEYAVKKLWI
jgi:hypothetical protein